MNQLKYCQQLFVSPQWLFGNITNPDNNTQDDSCIVVVDCRFSLTDPLLGRSQYQMGHIPGAYYLDLNQDLSGAVGQHGEDTLYQMCLFWLISWHKWGLIMGNLW